MSGLLARVFVQRPAPFFAWISDRYDSRSMHAALALLIAGAIGIHFLLIERYSVNVPVEDDYAFLSFASELARSESISRTWDLLFQQHNEHRMVVPKLVCALVVALYSELDFELLIVLGNLSLLGLLYLFYKLIPRDQRPLLALLAVSLLLFQAQTWESMVWAASALAYTPLVLFAGAACYFLPKAGARNLALSIAFASLATFTAGGGLLVFIAGMPYFFVSRRFQAGWVWSVAGLLHFIVYFFDYTWHVTMLHSPGDVLELSRYFFAFLGSAASMDNRVLTPLAFVFGLLAALYFLYLSLERYYAEHPELYFFMLLLLGEVAAATWTRSSIGLGSAFDSRYRIISATFLILAYLSIRERIPRERELLRTALSCCAIPLALLFNVLSYPQNQVFLRFHQEFYSTNLREWALGQSPLAGPPAFEPILNTALLDGIYRFPCELIPPESRGEVRWCRPPPAEGRGHPSPLAPPAS